MSSKQNISLVKNMEFGITSKFIPNICEAKTLKIVEIYDTSVRVEMKNSRSRGVFPLSHFQSLVRQGALIVNEKLENEETA